MALFKRILFALNKVLCNCHFENNAQYYVYVGFGGFLPRFLAKEGVDEAKATRINMTNQR